jgi:P27 family predicted phage terminase small subunit
MAGRKPKPTALKLIQGTHRKDRAAPNEPKPKQTARVPSPPAEMGKIAKNEWKRIASELHDMGVLTRIDTKALANYCQAYEDMLTARGLLHGWNLANPDQINVQKSMTGVIKTHPYLVQMREARLDMMKFAAEFGLTPSSRSRVSAKVKGDGDGWESF